MRAMPGSRACRRRKTARCRRCATSSCTGSSAISRTLTIAVNGGITTGEQVAAQLEHVDGVMVGREAYHNPWWLAQWDAEFFGEPPSGLTPRIGGRADVRLHGARGRRARHALELHRAPHAGLAQRPARRRRWRQVWSDHRLKDLQPRDVMALAHDAVAQAA